MADYTKRYPDELKDRVVAAFHRGGMPAARKLTDASPTAIRKWVTGHGMSAAKVQAASQVRINNAELSLRERALARQEELIPKLAVIAHMGLDVQIEYLRATGEALAIARSGQLLTPQILERLRVTELGVQMREAVNAATRAIHDLRLLTEQDTERHSGEIKVVLNAPRPDRHAPREILDLGTGTKVIEGERPALIAGPGLEVDRAAG